MTLPMHNPISGRLLRLAVVVFVLLTCVKVWLGPLELATPAQAQLPDSAAQRLKLIQAAERTNQLLEAILAQLKDGTLNVRPASTDKKSSKPSGPVRP